MDHYLDVPVDLSKVLFVCTANVVETIPGPLLDRMELIPLSGYVAEEKVAIATKYLIPAAKQGSGLSDSQVQIEDNAIAALIKNYCRESGVRNLKKHIEKIFRKSALKLLRDKSENLVISESNLRTFVGNPTFSTDRLYAKPPPGVVMGLAWTGMGKLWFASVSV
jgi:Lon-like ATP-dependent protease